MAKTAGRAKITVNGTFVDNFPGVTLDTGGIQRTPQPTAHRVHWSEKRVASKLEFDKAVVEGTSIHDLDLAGGVIQVEFDTGQNYVMKGAFRTEPESLGDEAKSKIVFQGEPCEEIL